MVHNVCLRQNCHLIQNWQIARLIDVSDDLRVWFLARWKVETNFSPATLSLTLAHSPQPIGREVGGPRITDQEDQRERERSPGAGYARQWMRVISWEAIRVDEVMTRNSRDGQLLSKRPLARPTKPILQQSLGIPPISFHIHINTTALCDKRGNQGFGGQTVVFLAQEILP